MSYSNPRIKLHMSMQDVVYEMSEGNPGAINVIMQMVARNEQIDPDDAFGPLGPLLSLDTLDVYGSRIYILYKYVCGQDIVATLAYIRATQLGLKSEADLTHSIDSETPIDTVALLKEVRERLPAFGQ